MHNWDIFSVFLYIQVCCLFSLEPPYRGDSNEYTQHNFFNIRTTITINYSKSAAMEIFPRDSGTSSKEPW